MKNRITVTVTPRASRNEIIGSPGNGEIKVKLTAAPVGGEANKKLIEILSKEWGVPKSRLKIVKGETSRKKIVEIL